MADSSELRTRGRHGIMHIVKVFPLPDSDLTADKIHGPFKQEFRILP
jgi:hypothetical protein